MTLLLSLCHCFRNSCTCVQKWIPPYSRFNSVKKIKQHKHDWLFIFSLTTYTILQCMWVVFSQLLCLWSWCYQIFLSCVVYEHLYKKELILWKFKFGGSSFVLYQRLYLAKREMLILIEHLASPSRDSWLFMNSSHSATVTVYKFFVSIILFFLVISGLK